MTNNFQGINDTFEGCIKDFKLNNKAVTSQSKATGVIPCSDNVEAGAFFSADGGYIKFCKIKYFSIIWIVVWGFVSFKKNIKAKLVDCILLHLKIFIAKNTVATLIKSLITMMNF